MYTLHAILRAEQAIAAFGVVDTLAHANRAAGEESGIDALRADALVDLILNPDGQSRVNYKMRVLVPFATLLGTQDTPGHVPGHGPIPAEVCRDLAADASWRRLLTDPDTGAALDLGADRYAPSDRLSEFVRTPRSAMPIPRLPPVRLAHGSGPHGRLQDRWTHDSDQPLGVMPSASQGQTPAGLDGHPGPRRHAHLHHTARPGLPNQTPTAIGTEPPVETILPNQDEEFPF
jgi:hypothetical protein